MATTSRQKLQIYHLISKQSVSFDAFVTEFNDKHSAEWSTEPVYGRMDDLQSFQRTKRSISLTIDCPSESEYEALLNLDRISSLKQFLYPSYEQRSNALSLQGGPLFRVKLLNFLNNHIDEEGILCTIASINFSPSQEAGFFILSSEQLNEIDTSKVYDLKAPMIVPKLFSISLEMNIIHEFTPGWTGKAGDKKFEKESYPYSVQYKKDRKPDRTLTAEQQKKLSEIISNLPNGAPPLPYNIDDPKTFDAWVGKVAAASARQADLTRAQAEKTNAPRAGRAVSSKG